MMTIEKQLQVDVNPLDDVRACLKKTLERLEAGSWDARASAERSMAYAVGRALADLEHALTKLAKIPRCSCSRRVSK